MPTSDIDNEVPKYRKRKNRKSKASVKSDHKHKYVPCIVNIIGSGTMLWMAEYCKTCGKLRIDKGIYHVERLDHGGKQYSKIDEAEVREKYGKYPLFRVSNYFQQSVTDEERSTLDRIYKPDSKGV